MTPNYFGILIILCIIFPASLCAVITLETNDTTNLYGYPIIKAFIDSFTEFSESKNNQQPEEQNLQEPNNDNKQQIKIPNKDFIWPSGRVPWKIHPPFKELLEYNVIHRLKEAMREIENNTCVRFEQIPDDVPLKSLNYTWVRVYEETNYTYPEGLNCKSQTGYTFPGKVLLSTMFLDCCLTKCLTLPGQELMLGRDCMDHSMILHELLHTLGFLHEHQRPDRDNYILINLENVPDFVQSQFELDSDQDVTLRDFDFESVLLYGPYDGSANGQPVMTRRDGKKMLERSDKSGLSQGDIDMINKLYNNCTVEQPVLKSV